jgi:hypothetical protein
MWPRNSRPGPSTRRTQLPRLSWAGWSCRRRLRPFGTCFCWCSWGFVCPWGSRPWPSSRRTLLPSFRGRAGERVLPAALCSCPGCLFSLGASRPRPSLQRTFFQSRRRQRTAPRRLSAQLPVGACLASAGLGRASHHGGLCFPVLACGHVLPTAAPAPRHLLMQMPRWFVWPQRTSASASLLIAAGSAPPFSRVSQSYWRRLRPFGTCLCSCCPGGLFGLDAPRPQPSSRRALLLRSGGRASLTSGGSPDHAPSRAMF